jgi:hypothetical protein
MYLMNVKTTHTTKFEARRVFLSLLHIIIDMGVLCMCSLVSPCLVVAVTSAKSSYKIEMTRSPTGEKMLLYVFIIFCTLRVEIIGRHQSE